MRASTFLENIKLIEFSFPFPFKFIWLLIEISHKICSQHGVDLGLETGTAESSIFWTQIPS